MPLYDLKNITHRYNNRTVLNIQDWQVKAHSVTGVVGPNGSGKSTLLALMAFITSPTGGKIRFNGQPVEPFDDLVRGKVVLLPQDSFLLKRSVYRNIVYGLQISRVRGDLSGRVHAAMSMVGLDPAVFAQRPWYALSGGETRRVALAARLVLQPQVLLMDEPTVSVDVASAQMIKEAALHARQQWGTTLVISSHDAEWLADICDTMPHLFRGRILGDGKQTMIFGPWKRVSDNTMGKALTADQYFMATCGSQDVATAVAAIAADQLVLYADAQQIPAGRHCLKGLLLRLSYEQTAGRTSAAVLVGRTVLTAYLDPVHPAQSTLLPGQKVLLAYDPDTIQWY
jgi:tungstate transport system ATP-binding protein